MQQLRRTTVCRIVAYFLIGALVAPQGLVCLPANAQTGQNVPTVAVIPFTDQTGNAGPGLMGEATAAAALALEDSREYVVISTTDLEREMLALRLKAPLSKAEQARLGERLHADKVLMGTLADLAVDSATGRARAALNLMLLDVPIGEYLDGAIASIETKTIPGFSGDIAAVTHEALRQVAESAVSQMLSSTVRRGTVELVDDLGNVNVNLGTDDGLQLGTELLVMRPTWQPDVEQVIMRQIAVIRVVDPEANMSVARVESGTMPTTGDRVFRIYKPAAEQRGEARKRNFKRTTQIIAGLALLLGIIAVAGGQNTQSASELECQLAQDRPGADPYVLLRVDTSNIALNKTHGWLFFRAANNANFPATAEFLFDAVAGRRLPNDEHTDEPFQFRVVEDFEINFTFVEPGEDSETDGSVTVSFNDAPLVRGTRYFYRVRRVIEPLNRPGSGAPIGTTQLVPVEPSIETDPDNRVLSNISNACGPVTFFTQPILSTPASGAVNLPTANITFTWAPSVGANEYIVQVFPETDPDGLNAPILQSSIRRDTGSAIMSATIAGPLDPDTTYFWRVGARQSGDPERPLNRLTGEEAWLYSEMRSFSTVSGPPPPPGTGSAVSPRVPRGGHGGFFRQWGAAGARGRR